MTSRSTILVTGTVGSGKSSLIHLITENDGRNINHSAIFEPRPQVYTDSELKDDQWEITKHLQTPIVFTDVPSEEAARFSVDDSKIALKNQRVEAVVFVYRIRQAYLPSHEPMYQGALSMAQHYKVPLLLVLTGTDLDNPMDIWWQENGKAFPERRKWTFDSIVSVHTICDYNINRMRVSLQPECRKSVQESRRLVLNELSTLTLRNNIHGKPWFTTRHAEMESFFNTIEKYKNTIVVATPSQSDFVECGLVTAKEPNSFIVSNTPIFYPSSELLKDGYCHDNVHLMMKFKPKFTKMKLIESSRAYSGLALDADGLWRMHSWIVSERSISSAKSITSGNCRTEGSISSGNCRTEGSITSGNSGQHHSLNPLDIIIIETTSTPRTAYYGRPCWCKHCSFVVSGDCYRCAVKNTGTLTCEICGANPHCDCCGEPCKICMMECCLICIPKHSAICKKEKEDEDQGNAISKPVLVSTAATTN